MIFVGYLDRAMNKLLSSGKSTFRQVRIYIIFVFRIDRESYRKKKKTQNHSHIISNYRAILAEREKKDRKRIRIIEKKINLVYVFHGFLCNSKYGVYICNYYAGFD